MDLKELFQGATTVKIKFRGHTTHHTFKTPTSEQDLEYRRRSAQVKVKGRTIETSDTALNSGLWLYEAVVEQVMVENGDGNPVEISKEDRKLIPNRVKLEAIGALLSDVEREDAEVLRD